MGGGYRMSEGQGSGPLHQPPPRLMATITIKGQVGRSIQLVSSHRRNQDSLTLLEKLMPLFQVTLNTSKMCPFSAGNFQDLKEMDTYKNWPSEGQRVNGLWIPTKLNMWYPRR